MKNIVANEKKRYPKHRGPDKKQKSVEDICSLVHDITSPTEDAVFSYPVFYAANLARLPAIDTAHLDVSTITQQISQMQSEIKQLSAYTELQASIAEIRSEVSSLVCTVADIPAKLSELSSFCEDFAFRSTTSAGIKITSSSTAAATTESISDVQSYSSHYEGVVSCPTDLSLDPTTVPSADDVAGASGNSTSYTFCVNTDQSTATIQNSVLSAVQDVQPVEGLTSTLPSDDASHDFLPVVNRRKERKRNKIVLGSGQSIPSSLRSLHPSSTRPSASVFVSRLPPAATEEDLTEFVKSVFRVNASCTKLVTGRFHSSFKVTVTGVGVRRLYDSRKWPEMVLVRQFYDHGSENV